MESGSSRYYGMAKVAPVSDAADQVDSFFESVGADLDRIDGGGRGPAAVRPPALLRPAQPAVESADWTVDRDVDFASAKEITGDDDDAAEDDEPLLSEAVEATLAEMKRGLERAKKKLDKSRAKEQSLRAELQQRQAELDVFRREQERARAEADAQERKRKAAEGAQAAQQRRTAARRRMLQADAAIDGGEAYDELGGGAARSDGPRSTLARLSNGYRQGCLQLERWYARSWPLARDVSHIETRFGTSVSVYFVYSEMICNLALGNALLWLGVQIISIAQLSSSAGPPQSGTLGTVMRFLPPRQLFYSAYGAQPDGEWSELSVAYATTVLCYMLW